MGRAAILSLLSRLSWIWNPVRGWESSRKPTVLAKNLAFGVMGTGGSTAIAKATTSSGRQVPPRAPCWSPQRPRNGGCRQARSSWPAGASVTPQRTVTAASALSPGERVDPADESAAAQRSKGLQAHWIRRASGRHMMTVCGWLETARRSLGMVLPTMPLGYAWVWRDVPGTLTLPFDCATSPRASRRGTSRRSSCLLDAFKRLGGHPRLPNQKKTCQQVRSSHRKRFAPPSAFHQAWRAN